MNLTEELFTSLLWILKTLSITAVVFSLVLYVLVRTTRWARQFWYLAAGYISPKNSFKPLSYFLLIVFMNLLSVRLDILFSSWYNAMYTALQEINATVFWQQMIIFSALATVHVFNVLLSYYLGERFSIQWRMWLNENMLTKWTEGRAYYKSQFLAEQLDNPDQRIQQDIQIYIDKSLSFATGVISSTVSLFAFTAILWNLSGPMTIAGVEIPHMIVFLVFIYVIISSLIAFKIGRPLIQLNFSNERLNANYRYSLIRLKEYAESIAFYRGENAEKNILFKQFNKVIDNLWAIVYRTLKLSGFNLAISQISVVFPLVIQASRYFSQQIKLGDLMQTAQAFGKVQNSLSFYRNSYDDFAAYRAVLDRLTGFNRAIQQTQQVSSLNYQENQDAISFRNLSICTPDGATLIENINLNLQQGQSLLIQGISGVGKTTLLRTIAGLWDYATGEISCPQKDSLFLSQKPYLPQGRLVDALFYPTTPPQELDTKQAEHLLQQVQLGHLSDKLLQENDWTRVLSLGEQQRLAFARLLLHKPKIAYLDEATASMDEGLEDAMYRLIKQSLPDLILISVGHRSTLHQHHEQQLVIHGNTTWQWLK